jgi:hypothetical protein
MCWNLYLEVFKFVIPINLHLFELLNANTISHLKIFQVSEHSKQNLYLKSSIYFYDVVKGYKVDDDGREDNRNSSNLLNFNFLSVYMLASQHSGQLRRHHKNKAKQRRTKPGEKKKNKALDLSS